MNKTTIAQQAKTASLKPPAQSSLQRKCACGNYMVAGSKCAECAKKKSGLQRKLTIGASNDPLEQEADQVADQVLAAPAHSTVSAVPPRIQRFTGQATEGMDTAPASVDRVLASSGWPLEPALQQDMGQRFGHDFSRVRVHSGAAAEQSARDVNAKAYTVGRNVVFGAGWFAPGRRWQPRNVLPSPPKTSSIRSSSSGTLRRRPQVFESPHLQAPRRAPRSCSATSFRPRGLLSRPMGPVTPMRSRPRSWRLQRSQLQLRWQA